MPPDELGARLQTALGDAYTVERQLGAGGFAVVYLVRDLSLKRNLAVKVLSPELVKLPTVLERFRREAEVVARLSHPNIVPLHFVGQQGDLLYLVMEAIGGGSLADRLARERRLPVADATQIFAEIAGALGHAHKRGVIHRDIKPQNVLLDADSGRALVTDFGIARTAEGVTLTASGTAIGTPNYLSPERVSGDPSDHRADIYALGVVAYEMFAGRPPFSGPTPAAAVMKRLAAVPESLKRLRPEVPDALAELVHACLALEPDDRPGDAAGLARMLSAPTPVSRGHTTRTARRVDRARSRWKALALGASVLALIAVVVAALTQPGGGIPSNAVLRPPIDSGMVLIPGGTYIIGSNTGREVSRPAHPVRLDPFGIGAREVTIGEYQDYVEAKGAPVTWGAGARPELPVTGVVLAEAAGYCAWRHRDGGRLPTETEWEAAARGAGQRSYPWGETWDPAAANVGNLKGQVHPVGGYSRGRTPEGLEDMIGNVWEWTASPFAPSYRDSSRSVAGFYVIRGGAYNSPAEVANAFFRGRAQSSAARKDLASTGFRCAMSARSVSPP